MFVIVVQTIYCEYIFTIHCSQNGWTALMIACFQGHEKVVELLLTAGSKVDLQNKVIYSVC